MEQRTTLKETQSGKIELVFNGLCLRLQFNGPCLEMLPFCKALCCRLRYTFSVVLRKEEVGKFQSQQHPHSPHLQILQSSENGSCTYLAGDEMCEVHKDKPWMCRAYHCSPGGIGEGIQHRDGGFLLSPWKCVENVDDEGTVVDLNELRRK